MKRSSGDNHAMQDNVQRNCANGFMRFGLVGVLGFIVDSGILCAAIGLGLDHYSSRGISFFCAVTVTWLANRKLTFSQKGRPTLSEWSRYVVANIAGSIVNLAVYTIMIYTILFVSRFPIIGVGVGSISGMYLNYTLSRRVVFKN